MARTINVAQRGQRLPHPRATTISADYRPSPAEYLRAQELHSDPSLSEAEIHERLIREFAGRRRTEQLRNPRERRNFRRMDSRDRRHAEAVDAQVKGRQGGEDTEDEETWRPLGSKALKEITSEAVGARWNARGWPGMVRYPERMRVTSRPGSAPQAIQGGPSGTAQQAPAPAPAAAPSPATSPHDSRQPSDETAQAESSSAAQGQGAAAEGPPRTAPPPTQPAGPMAPPPSAPASAAQRPGNAQSDGVPPPSASLLASLQGLSVSLAGRQDSVAMPPPALLPRRQRPVMAHVPVRQQRLDDGLAYPTPAPRVFAAPGPLPANQLQAGTVHGTPSTAAPGGMQHVRPQQPSRRCHGHHVATMAQAVEMRCFGPGVVFCTDPQECARRTALEQAWR